MSVEPCVAHTGHETQFSYPFSPFHMERTLRSELQALVFRPVWICLEGGGEVKRWMEREREERGVARWVGWCLSH